MNANCALGLLLRAHLADYRFNTSILTLQCENPCAENGNVGVNRYRDFSRQASQDGNLCWKGRTRNVGWESGLGQTPVTRSLRLVHADCLLFTHRRLSGWKLGLKNEKSFGIVRWTDCSRTRRNVGQEGGTSADALVTRSRIWFTKLLWNCTRKLLGGVGDNPLSVRQSLSRGSLSL